MHSTNYINWNWDRYSKNVKIYKPSPLKTNYFGNQYYDNIKQYIKPKPIPPIYVWRSLGDGKVRSSHQENDGKIFTRDNPPPTGHPGQGYNCRCIAEPYIKGVTEYGNQTVISDVGEHWQRWNGLSFLGHFWVGGGETVNLAKVGHLKGVINYYSYDLGVMKKVNQQIIDKALSLNRPGYFEYDFKQSYDFGSYRYYFGGSTVGGKFRGHIKYLKDIAYVTGTIDYEFSDIFTDITSMRQEKIGTSDPKEVSDKWRNITDILGTNYDIIGNWTTRFEAEIPVRKHYKSNR